MQHGQKVCGVGLSQANLVYSMMKCLGGYKGCFVDNGSRVPYAVHKVKQTLDVAVTVLLKPQSHRSVNKALNNSSVSGIAALSPALDQLST